MPKQTGDGLHRDAAVEEMRRHRVPHAMEGRDGQGSPLQKRLPNASDDVGLTLSLDAAAAIANHKFPATTGYTEWDDRRRGH